jgi:hypothetical protein
MFYYSPAGLYLIQLHFVFCPIPKQTIRQRHQRQDAREFATVTNDIFRRTREEKSFQRKLQSSPRKCTAIENQGNLPVCRLYTAQPLTVVRPSAYID